MANYAVEPGLLQPAISLRGPTLNCWEGRSYVSLVGFLFQNTRLKGFRIPFHTNYEEVNLRSYVRYRSPEGDWRRGVFFLSEIVSKGRPGFLYSQPVLPKNTTGACRCATTCTGQKKPFTVQYEWKNGGWNSLCVVADTEPADQDPLLFRSIYHRALLRVYPHRCPANGEYRVEHPVWNTYPVQGFEIKSRLPRVVRPLPLPFLEGREARFRAPRGGIGHQRRT